MTLALMVDLSSNNPTPNLRAHWNAGYRVLSLKVTEGTGYVWADSHKLAAQWHSFGPDAVVWHYHFLHPGSAASGAQQADWFYVHVKADLRAGDRVVCDVETKGETGAEVAAFWARYVSHDPHTPRVDYGSPYFLRDNGIRPQHGEGLWLADYAAKITFIPPGWTGYLAWQYTAAARGVPGMGGPVDQSHLAAGALPAQPKPTPHVASNPYAATPPVLPFDASTAAGHAPDRVRWVQWALGFTGAALDGICGKDTRAALLAFKKAHGLAPDLIIRQQAFDALKAVHR